MKYNLFDHPKKEVEIKKEEPKQVIPKNDWRDKYTKKQDTGLVDLEKTLDDSVLNQVIQLKNIDQTKTVQGKPGTLYYDKSNKKVKIFISEADGWADLDYTL